MNLFWTRRARYNRKNIREYIARDNPAAALALDSLITERAALLVEHPDLGRPGRVAHTRELVVHPSFVLVYDVAANAVRVLRVLHAARRWPPQATESGQ